MCVQPIILLQYRDKTNTFHSHYYCDYIPERHTRSYLLKLHLTHFGKKFVVVPCGKCVDCVRRRARDWKVRLYHHSLTEGDSIFVTLTYNDDNIEDNSLNYTHFQLFMKRLRKIFSDRSLTYFVAGEYGTRTLRRHFHCIIFGLNINDVKSTYFCRSRSDKRIKIYLSNLLEHCWSTNFVFKNISNKSISIRGFVSVSSVISGDPRAFGYVAGYIISKSNVSHKIRISQLGLAPEFHHMSLKNPIGKKYFFIHYKQIYQLDACHFGSKLVCVPKAYDNWYKVLTERYVIRRRFCEPDLFNFIFNSSDSSYFDKMSFIFKLSNDYDFCLDKVSEFDIIKEKRRLKYASSTGLLDTTYQFYSKRLNLECVFNNYDRDISLFKE